MIQEWMEFRCESVRRRFEEMHRHIRALSPDVVIEYNVYPYWGENAAFWRAVDMARLLPYLDAFWNEHDPFPEYTADRRLIHRTRSYKLARAAGVTVSLAADQEAAASLYRPASKPLALKPRRVKQGISIPLPPFDYYAVVLVGGAGPADGE